jgi:hypothetical protein
MYENLSFEDAIRTEKSAKKRHVFFEKSAFFRHFFQLFVIFNIEG